MRSSHRAPSSTVRPENIKGLYYKYESDADWQELELIQTSFNYWKGPYENNMEAVYDGNIPKSFVDDDSEDIQYYFLVYDHDDNLQGVSENSATWYGDGYINVGMSVAQSNPYSIDFEV